MATKRALIVDDSKTAQFRLRKMLREYDLAIVAVDSAEAALSHLASNLPDVVFLDHMMPGLDGFRALQIIKSHPVTADLPVIMYTSKSGDLYASEARALGALDILNKDNVDAEQLQSVLSGIGIYPGAQTPENLALTRPAPSSNRSGGDELLALDMRMRELERTIDDNRRIVTTRLLKEIQMVRQTVRKVLGEVAELKQQGLSRTAAQAPAVKRRAGRYWSALATIALIGAVGASLYWAPEISQKVDRMVAFVQQEIRQYQHTRASAPQTQAQPQAHALAAAAVTNLPPYNSLFPMPGETPQMDLLPDLAWAFNQNSIQEYHPDGVDPALTKRLDELASRLASKNFQGVIELQVTGGDFCVVTSLSGKPRLPHNGAQMRDCMLISELYGADSTQSTAQYLRAALANAAALDERRIAITVLPSNELFDRYPEADARTLAQDWNAAARQNNRVLVRLKPQAPAQTAQRQ